jgi:glutaredoxin
MRLILYSKPGCHLCEGLQEKLEQIQSFGIALEVRDITTREDWFQQYQYEIPVMFLAQAQTPSAEPVQAQDPSAEPVLLPIPRPSPRASVRQLEQMLQKYLQDDPPQ